MASRILVVEDEEGIALGLQDGLEAEGYAVEVVRDGVTAESKIRHGGYDLILLDLMLPGKDGLAVCSDLRGTGVRTPIIVLTARTQEIDRVLGLELGADDYVTKPFSPRELAARVKAVLRRTSEGRAKPGDVWQHEDLAIDFRRFAATRDGAPVELTPMEFRLLRAFVDHRGDVLSVRRLIDLVWGQDTFLTDRVIYTHVNNLRGKIERDPANPTLIVGIRGVGYRFDG